MPGMLLDSFYQGNRSEYLAHYILSALGVAVKVPHEEDIGVDFNCTLARKEGRRLIFGPSFLVQVKSIADKNELIYGGPDKKTGVWRKTELDWLFTQDLPLLIGLADKSRQELSLYITCNMWHAYYMKGDIGQVTLLPAPASSTENPISQATLTNMPEWTGKGIGSGERYDIPLGPPILTISLDDTENPDKVVHYRQALDHALHWEQQNITYRRLRVHYSISPTFIKTNEPLTAYVAFFAANPVPGANTTEQLQSVAPILTALAFNFKLQSAQDSLEKMKSIVQLLNQTSLEVGILRAHVPELFT